MSKKTAGPAIIPSWYPTPGELLATQRAQMETSKREATEFASQAFHPSAAPWWRRIFGLG